MNVKTNLEKPIYDVSQLKRAIDTNVVELKPNFPNVNSDLVLTEIYNEKLLSNDSLRGELNNLVNEDDQLQQEIGDLNSAIEQLQIELEESMTGKTNSISQLQILNNEILKLETLLKEAIQKAIEYGIDKVSIAAQNDVARVAIEITNKEIEELKSELRISGDSSKMKEILTNSKFDTEFDLPDVPDDGTLPDDTDDPIDDLIDQFSLNKVKIDPIGLFEVSADNRNTKPTIPFSVSITNNNKESVHIRVQHIEDSKNWRAWLGFQPTYIVPANGSTTLNFEPIGSIVSKLKPANGISFRGTRTYRGKLLIFVNNVERSSIETIIKKSK